MFKAALSFFILHCLINKNKFVTCETCEGKTFDNIGYIDAVKHCMPKPFASCSDPQFVFTRFLIFTFANKNEPFVVNHDLENIKNAPIDSNAKTILITHGYRGSLPHPRNKGYENTKNLFLQKLNATVQIILVDYGNGSKGTYQQAIANSKVVAKQIALFVITLKTEFSISLLETTFIGLSLGARLLVLAAKNIFDVTGEKVGHIIGLDPAGPCFKQDGDYFTKFDVAHLIEVIHTDQAFFAMRMRLLCNHYASLSFTIVDYENFTDCQPVAYQCTNYDDFIKGRCASCEDNKCQLLGYSIQIFHNFSKKNIPSHPFENRKLFLRTSPSPSFCSYHFQVVGSSKNQIPALCSGLEIQIENEKNFQASVNSYKLAHDNMTGLLVIDAAEVNFQNPAPFVVAKIRTKTRKFFCSNLFDTIQINYLSNLDESIREKFSSKLCKNKGSYVLCGRVNI
ncbi:pancreatic triacylglycerol lipase-like protein [Dinothrombium tinctorium]|uniref:Pancreatic triacylglycerol lipase-like protein n=1 Tax=Dinothrombium tinctorium TaxID=1965070 RepID=A0A443QLR0_9ACAR|nr:pancreatic triacylglycerol lipase-like protein [Dinothrombium tinctorium]RWS03955.1 pancreatic triacylglycerol lipase-like protein [Dinothrombium tinctorium]